MSIIRRHGVTFHLLPTPDDFEDAVEEWLGTVIHGSINGISIPLCRSCKGRRRDVGHDHDGNPLVEFLVEHSFDLCLQCANHLEQTNPWIRRYVQERFCHDEENNW